MLKVDDIQPRRQATGNLPEGSQSGPRTRGRCGVNNFKLATRSSKPLQKPRQTQLQPTSSNSKITYYLGITYLLLLPLIVAWQIFKDLTKIDGSPPFNKYYILAGYGLILAGFYLLYILGRVLKRAPHQTKLGAGRAWRFTVLLTAYLANSVKQWLGRLITSCFQRLIIRGPLFRLCLPAPHRVKPGAGPVRLPRLSLSTYIAKFTRHRLALPAAFITVAIISSLLTYVITSRSKPGYAIHIPKTYDQALELNRGEKRLGIIPIASARAKAKFENNKYIYAQAYPKTDVIQHDHGYKIKEELVFHEPGHPTRFEYQIKDIEKYEVIKNKHGSIVFYDKELIEQHGGEINDLSRVFTISRPFLEDKNKDRSFTAVRLEINGDILVYTLNQSWLKTAQYPVILDPTIEIHIINPHSHPALGEDWTVKFTTIGTADLKIIPDDEATIYDDEFVSLSCNGEIREPQILPGDVIFYPDWECEATGQVVHRTLKTGKHTLRFEFGPPAGGAGDPENIQTAYAYNSWYDSDWNYRKYIIIDADQVATTTSDFPVLATTTDPDLKHTSYGGHVASSTGADISFTDITGAKLNYEREYYSSSTGELVAWIRTDISSTTDTVLYMYYGNASSTEQATTTGVWDDNYVGVWHLDETPANGETHYDSTLYANDGTFVDTDGDSNTNATGKIDGADDFDGNTGEGDYEDYINVGNDSSVRITGAMTISVWVNAEVNQNKEVVNKLTLTRCYSLGTDTGTTHSTYNFAISSNGSDEIESGNTAELTSGQWYYLVGVYKPSTAVQIYTNGVFDNENTTSIPASQYDCSSNNLYIANREDITDQKAFEGIIDEVRISSTSRSAAWIKTSYNNQSNVNSFLSFGPQEGSPLKIYRSVGNTSSDLKNAATVTISGYTATFSAAQPNNVGVGDVIQYGGGSYFRLAFITGRASSTEYSVQSWDGAVPTATTSASMSIYRAHLELDDWEDRIANTSIDSSVSSQVLNGTNLVASNTIMMVACYWASSVDNDPVNINGWTTASTTYIKIYTPYLTNEVGESQGHSGKWDDGKYRLEANVGYGPVLEINEDNVRIYGLQAYNTRSAEGTPHVIEITNGNAGDIYIAYNILKNNWQGGVNNNYGGICNESAANNQKLYIFNNIFYDANAGIYVDGLGNNYTSWEGYIYNNTVAGNTLRAGIYLSRSNSIVKLKNNLVQGSSMELDNYFFEYWSQVSATYVDNLSEDTSSPNNEHDTKTVIFLNEADDDFHLHPEDTAAIDAGTSSVSSIVTDDIDGRWRGQYDIGADEASVYFESYIMEGGEGDFSGLSSWETSAETDLTATTTAVFSATSTTGTIQDNATITGSSSGATATVVTYSGISSQILLENINGTFISSEDIGTGNGTTTLSNAGNPAIAVAKIDGTWSSADGSAVTITGWTTGEYNYIRIYTTDTARHQGKWDTNKYRLEKATTDFNIKIKEPHVRIDGLQVYKTTAVYGEIGISDFTADMDIKISNCIIRGSNVGISSSGTLSGNLYIWNNIIYDASTGIRAMGSSPDYYFYSNTISGGWAGIKADDAPDVLVKNNLIQNTSGDCFNTWGAGSFASESDYNISDDATAPGSNSKTNTEVTFRDEANDDFRLSTDDTAAKNAGINLSSDTNLAFTDDIEGHTRSDTGWDIGADEAPTILYRSVGNDSSPISSGATVTITVATNTVTAAFSAPQPDNIGVGDVLQIGPPYSLAFIMGRNSDTEYQVQAWDGSAPTATTSANVNVYRAHLKLDDWEDHDEDINDVNPGIDDSVDDYVIMFSDDLPASNTAMFVPCYASTSPDNLAVDINSWTTATSNYIKIYTPVDSNEVGVSQRHSGKWDTGKYRMEITTNRALMVQENYVRAEGIQFLITRSNDLGDIFLVQNQDASNEIRISHNIIKGNFSVGDYYTAININDTDIIAKIWNNIIYDYVQGTASALGIGVKSCSSVYAYNNTIHNSLTGILRKSTAGGTVTAKNNLYQSNGISGANGYSGTFTSSDYNLSDLAGDTTGGFNDKAGVTVLFLDPANNDFHLSPSDIAARDAGANLSGIFTDDIDGVARENTWDIGADEVLPKPKYRFSPGGTFKFQGTVKFE